MYVRLLPIPSICRLCLRLEVFTLPVSGNGLLHRAKGGVSAPLEDLRRDVVYGKLRNSGWLGKKKLTEYFICKSDPARSRGLSWIWKYHSMEEEKEHICIDQSAFQCVVNPPSKSSFPKYSSSAYNPIVPATLIHLHRFPPASPP